MNKDSIKYVEPADYFPKHLRKKHKLGEYAETTQNSDAELEDKTNISNSQDK